MKKKNVGQPILSDEHSFDGSDASRSDITKFLDCVSGSDLEEKMWAEARAVDALLAKALGQLSARTR